MRFNCQCLNFLRRQHASGPDSATVDQGPHTGCVTGKIERNSNRRRAVEARPASFLPPSALGQVQKEFFISRGRRVPDILSPVDAANRALNASPLHAARNALLASARAVQAPCDSENISQTSKFSIQIVLENCQIEFKRVFCQEEER